MPTDPFTSLSGRLQQMQEDAMRRMDIYERQTASNQMDGVNSFYTGGSVLRSGFSSNAKSSEAHKDRVAVQVLGQIKTSARTFTADEATGDTIATKADEYKALGLTAIAEVLERRTTKILKEMAISVAGYKRMNRQEINNFKIELDNISDFDSKRRLLETPLEHYIGQNYSEGNSIKEADLAVPPADVLEKLKVAKEAKLFDAFSVLHIQRVPDPILCGKINESDDLYTIADWGDDVRLSDIIKS